MRERPTGRIPVCVAVMMGVGAAAPGVRGEIPAFLQKPSAQHLRVMCYNVNWDSIFENGDPNNHPWRAYDMSDQFVRVVQAVRPDIICLQEINQDRSPQTVAALLNTILPLEDGIGWRVFGGSDNFIAAPYELSLLATDTVPTTARGHAQALLDLPDERFAQDLLIINAHFKAGGSSNDIQRRQQHADAIINWMRDMQNPGGLINVPTDTPILVLGDLNVFDTDPAYHLTTLVTGDIVFEQTFGPDYPADWDGTELTDVLPLHNGVGPEFYTWRQDGGSFNPGALDRILFTDSVMSVDHSFVLNTMSMTPEDRAAAGLLAGDVVLNPTTGYFDHLPLVADFFIPQAAGCACGDLDGDGIVSLVDFATLAGCFGAALPTGGCPVETWSCADLNQDGLINLVDFNTFASLFGLGAGGPPPDCGQR